MKRVVVIGDCMIDETWYGVAEKLSPEAPIPVIQLKEIIQTPGGALNVAANISSLGGKEVAVYVCGWTDLDLIDKWGLNLAVCPCTMTKINLNVKRRIVDSHTGYQIVRVDNEKITNCINRPLDRIAIMRYLATIQPDAIVFSDYNKGAIQWSLAGDIIREYRDKSRIYVDSRNPAADMYKGATYMTPNRKEVVKIAKYLGVEVTPGILESEAMYKICDDLDLGSLIVTKGEDGMSCYSITSSEELFAFNIPATNRYIVDVTGAGDVALATMVAAEMTGCKDLQLMLSLANKLAGESCMSKGTVILKPSLAERGHKWE